MLLLLVWPKVITLSGFYCNIFRSNGPRTIWMDTWISIPFLEMEELRIGNISFTNLSTREIFQTWILTQSVYFFQERDLYRLSIILNQILILGPLSRHRCGTRTPWTFLFRKVYIIFLKRTLNPISEVFAVLLFINCFS